MKNLLGVVIGAAIDRKDGDSGIKGAAEGYLLESAIKIAVPLVVALGVGWAIQHFVRRGLSLMASELERQKAAAGTA